MSKESLLSLMEANWDDALLKAFRIKGSNEYHFLENVNFRYKFDKNDFSDFTETVRFQLDVCTVEVHYDYGYMGLFAPVGEEEKMIEQVKFKNGNKASMNKAMKKILETYFEYQRDVEMEHNER